MKKFISLIFTLCLITTVLHAQNNVTGKVTSVDNTPLPGVTVLEVGTTNGTVTDTDGNYTLNVSADAEKIAFSFIGLETQIIKIGGNSIINVTLKEDSYALDEVVAIGYGTVRKSDLTGSVAQVKVDDLDERSIGSAEQLLQGVTSGVLVRTTSGAPGAAATAQTPWFRRS